jgi:hypothetical protein
MPHRELIQAEPFVEAVRSTLTRSQTVQLLSALASLGKDEGAMKGHDWVEIAPLAGGPEDVVRIVIRDEDDTCWSAFVVFDDDHNALVILYAAPGDEVSMIDLQRIERGHAAAVREMGGSQPTGWRW